MAQPIAYSYIRFSTKAQEEGDSLRRQTKATKEWCERNEADLDDSLKFHDRGVSAFRGKNRDLGHLGEFLKLVEGGRVPPGSYLVVESLDRLTRQDTMTALRLVLDMIDKGIRIVQLTPQEMVYDKESDSMAIMMMIMELSRGHSESKVKSERVGEAWDSKREGARGGGCPLTTRVPAWLKAEDVRRDHKGRLVAARLVVRPARVRVVRRMFRLALAGYGLGLIVKELSEGEHAVAPWGRGRWNKIDVHRIITGRAVLGEFQARKGRRPDGPPIPDYYPRVIDEDTWRRAQNALARRKRRPGRVGDKVANLFTGLLYDARWREKMHVEWQFRGTKAHKARRRKVRCLVRAGALQGRRPATSFPADVFEKAVLGLLREIKAADVLGEQRESETPALTEELASIEARQAAVEEELKARGGDPTKAPALARLLGDLDDQRADVLRRLQAARALDANPPAAALAEAKTLLDAATDLPRRLLLKDLLGNIIDNIWVLVVPHKTHRYAAVQIRFREGARRDYAIHYWAAGFNREGGYEVMSVRHEAGAAGLDLSVKKDADLLAQALAEGLAVLPVVKGGPPYKGLSVKDLVKQVFSRSDSLFGKLFLASGRARRDDVGRWLTALWWESLGDE
jgi:DNA invertase Pin-like site-specific DNA recombinase